MLKFTCTVAALTAALVAPSFAQSSSTRPDSTNVLGVWRGTSTCLVRPSACNDEVVVFRITPMKAADSIAVDGRKIVRGEEQEMGVLSCRLARASGELTCVIPQGTWRFSVRRDSMTGEVRTRDDTRFREVRAIRSK